MVVSPHAPVETRLTRFNYIQACRAVSFCMCGATVDASSVDPHVIYPGIVPSVLEGASVFLRGSSVVKIES